MRTRTRQRRRGGRGVTVTSLVRDIRERLDKRLGARGRRRPFPEIAAEVLQELALHENLEPTEFLQTLFREGGCPTPHRAKEIVALYDDPRFVINAHLWLDTYAVPHSHNWEGAFQVLSGESLYSTYRFTPTVIDQQSFKVGTVETVDTHVLKPGDVRAVDAGLGCIHSIFHLDRPALNVSIRGDVKDHSLTVWPTGVAEETDLVEGHIETRIKSLSVLSASNPKACDAAIEEFLRTADLRTINLILPDAMLRHTKRERVVRLARSQRSRLGPGVSAVVDTAEEHMRTRWFIDLRAKLTSKDHRFFLGLVSLCADRETIFRLVADRYPRSSPVDRLTNWVRDLTRASDQGPSPTRISLGDESIEVFRLLMEHGTAEAAAIATTSTPAKRRATAARLREAEQAFRQIRLFRPFFQRAAR